MIILNISSLNVDEQTFVKTLVEKYEKDIYKISLHFLKNQKEDAEDCAQTAWMKIIEKIDLLEQMPEEDQKRYIFRITKNTAIDCFRKRYGTEDKPKPDFLEINDEILNSIDVPFITYIEDKDVLIRAMLRLSPRQREYLLAARYYDFDYQAIQERFNVNYSTAWKNVSRAKEALRKELEKELSNQ